MLEIIQQIILRLVLGNTRKNKKYQMKGSSVYSEKLTQGKEVYYIVPPVNAGIYEGLCSWFYGIIKKFAIASTVLLIDAVVVSYKEGSLKENISLGLFLFSFIWGLTIGCDVAYQYFERTMWILTKEGVIYSNIWGKVKHISYEEIKEVVSKKKATIRLGSMWIPYRGGKMPIQLYTELSTHEVIPILNRECGLELPDMSRFATRERVRRGGMGSILLKVGIIVFLCIFCFGEMIGICSYGEVRVYWDENMWLLHGMADLWMIVIGFVCRIVFYYPTWKFFRPYTCVKVR